MTANLVTTTVTTTTSTQTGTQISVGSSANTVQVGNFVTNVSLNPYIAAQIISFYATGLRPNATIHAFFDSVNVDQYCSNGVRVNGATTGSSNMVRPTTPMGTPLVTDSTGTIYGTFNIPAGIFKTGDRVFELADVNNLAQGNSSITTQATAVFTASNLNVTNQGVTLTTVNPTISVIPVSNTVVTTNTSVTSTAIPCNINYYPVYTYQTRCENQPYVYGPPPVDPIAQSFTVNTPDGSSGVFVTSLNLYFEQKPISQTNGITVYICETSNGNPNSARILPFSTTHLPWSSVLTSSNSTVATTFTFESPVFLMNGVTYAFVVKPDGGDPDYRVYDANLGDTDIATGVQVFSQPNVGTAFMGATASQWTALQTKYIKYDLYAAQFSPRSGVARFNNANTDYITLQNLTYNLTSSSILPGDYVIQSTNSTVTTANTLVYGIVRSFNSGNNYLYIENSTGNFTPNTYAQVHRFSNSDLFVSPGPNTMTLQAYGNTGSFHSIVVDALVPNFAYISPAGSSVNFDYLGTSNTYTQDTVSNLLVYGTQTCFFDQERRVYGKSIEALSLSGNKSATLEANLQSDSVWVSPLIDTVKSYQQAIQNLVFPVGNYYYELYNNGNERTKYVSQIVTLASGQDAEDLQITLTAHRPPGTDIKVYVKFLNGSDPDPISAKTWTPLINQSSSVYSNPSNVSNYNEFTYTVNRQQQYIFRQLTGTITSSNSSTTVTGSSTTFGTDAFVGAWVTTAPNTTFTEAYRQIVSVSNTTQLVLNTPFNGNYSSANLYLVFPPTTAWVSNTSTTQLGASNGAVTYSNGVVIATATVNTTSNIITGSNTNFLTLQPGQIIEIGGYQQPIVSISNSTLLTVGTTWPANFTGANVYIATVGGLSYLNSNNNIYNTFKKFQIKVNLQSNDSSKVPLVSDLTALALQL